MSSKVEICNIALARLAVTIRINSLDEASVQAENCKLFYDSVVDRVLARFDWPFARKSLLLADLGDPPVNWGYRYQYPSDCVRLRGLVTEGLRRPRLEQIPPYALEAYSGSTTIVTDVAQARMTYTSRVADPTLYPPRVASSIAWLLAVELCMPLSVNEKRMQLAQQMFSLEIDGAAADAANEVVDDLPPESEFVAGRR